MIKIVTRLGYEFLRKDSNDVFNTISYYKFHLGLFEYYYITSLLLQTYKKFNILLLIPKCELKLVTNSIQLLEKYNLSFDIIKTNNVYTLDDIQEYLSAGTYAIVNPHDIITNTYCETLNKLSKIYSIKYFLHSNIFYLDYHYKVLYKSTYNTLNKLYTTFINNSTKKTYKSFIKNTDFAYIKTIHGFTHPNYRNRFLFIRNYPSQLTIADKKVVYDIINSY